MPQTKKDPDWCFSRPLFRPSTVSSFQRVSPQDLNSMWWHTDSVLYMWAEIVGRVPVVYYPLKGRKRDQRMVGSKEQLSLGHYILIRNFENPSNSFLVSRLSPGWIWQYIILKYFKYMYGFHWYYRQNYNINISNIICTYTLVLRQF